MNELNFDKLPENLEIVESFLVADSKIKGYDPEKIMISISGGADSDIMLYLVSRINSNVHFVFFDTGLEYEATKEHLKFLENKYGVKIEIERAKKPIPTSCRKYGQPFLSKKSQ